MNEQDRQLSLLRNTSKMQESEITSSSSSKEDRVVESKVKGIYLLKLSGETKWKIIMGNNVVSEKTFKTKRRANKYIKSKPIELLLTLSITAVKQANIIESRKNKTKKKAV